MNPDKIRKVYAPYSTTGEQVGQTPLEGYVDVAQAIYPAVNTGQISKDGEWSGVTVSDKEFKGFTKAEGIPNTGVALFPDSNSFPSINMTGYKSIFIAIKPNNGGNVAIAAVMGPDTVRFANLTPVNAASNLLGNLYSKQEFQNLLTDSSEALTADVWNIFFIQDTMQAQKNMQFKVTNSNLGESNIEFAFLRVV